MTYTLSPDAITAANRKTAGQHASFAGWLLREAGFPIQRALVLQGAQTIVIQLDPATSKEHAVTLRRNAQTFLARCEVHVSTTTVTPQHQALLMLHNPRWIDPAAFDPNAV